MDFCFGCTILIEDFSFGGEIRCLLSPCRLADLKEFKEATEIYARCKFYRDTVRNNLIFINRRICSS